MILAVLAVLTAVQAQKPEIKEFSILEFLASRPELKAELEKKSKAKSVKKEPAPAPKPKTKAPAKKEEEVSVASSDAPKERKPIRIPVTTNGRVRANSAKSEDTAPVAQPKETSAPKNARRRAIRPRGSRARARVVTVEEPTQSADGPVTNARVFPSAL